MNSSRSSQWKFMLKFCEQDSRDPLPVAKRNLVEFIGWLKYQRETGARKVSAT